MNADFHHFGQIFGGPPRPLVRQRSIRKCWRHTNIFRFGPAAVILNQSYLAATCGTMASTGSVSPGLSRSLPAAERAASARPWLIQMEFEEIWILYRNRSSVSMNNIRLGLPVTRTRSPAAWDPARPWHTQARATHSRLRPGTLTVTARWAVTAARSHRREAAQT